jgi:hypothetical protein
MVKKHLVTVALHHPDNTAALRSVTCSTLASEHCLPLLNYSRILELGLQNNFLINYYQNCYFYLG